MPGKNATKIYVGNSYYHVYNRGVAKQIIFRDVADKQKFVTILRRHLDPFDHSLRQDGRPYRKFDQDIELLCYCLMGNHFHLLLYVGDDTTALSAFMKSVLTAYTMYFNQRYKRVGALFQGVFKASRIHEDTYLLHITRYIHLNPRTYKTYRYSSLRYYLGEPAPDWLRPRRILELFENLGDYSEFLEDYEDRKTLLSDIKAQLAHE